MGVSDTDDCWVKCVSTAHVEREVEDAVNGKTTSRHAVKDEASDGGMDVDVITNQYSPT
jgi:hypothetical protein